MILKQVVVLSLNFVKEMLKKANHDIISYSNFNTIIHECMHESKKSLMTSDDDYHNDNDENFNNLIVIRLRIQIRVIEIYRSIEYYYLLFSKSCSYCCFFFVVNNAIFCVHNCCGCCCSRQIL